MVKYPQMKFAASVLVALLVHASAFARARVVVPSLPEAVRPDAEVSTNIALNVNAARLQTLTLSVEFESCVTNEVLVALGADADSDGDLTIDEADIVFGCDCGAWYRADLRTGEIETAMTNALVIGKRQFDPAWNHLKVVRRGFGEIGEAVEKDEERVRFDIRIRRWWIGARFCWALPQSRLSQLLPRRRRTMCRRT